MGELQAVYANGANHVVLIDDARLFVNPPPPPHRQSDWPKLGDILAFLAQQEPAPYVRVVGDVVVAAPARAREVVEGYCREREH